jgi:hypothetical protein
MVSCLPLFIRIAYHCVRSLTSDEVLCYGIHLFRQKVYYLDRSPFNIMYCVASYDTFRRTVCVEQAL